MMNMLLLAQSRGISSLVINGYDEEKIVEAFKIPKRFHVSGVVGFGYKPEGYIYHRRPRFPIGIVVVCIVSVDKVMFDGFWKKEFNWLYVCCIYPFVVGILF